MEEHAEGVHQHNPDGDPQLVDGTQAAAQVAGRNFSDVNGHLHQDHARQGSPA